MDTNHEVIVVGGGAAGLSAALVLGRARRRTLVIDAGRQSNLAAEGIGGLLGHNERPPAELYAAGREEIGGHPTVEVRSGEVVGGERTAEGFVLELEVGAREAAPRVLLATGMDYRFPDIPGMAERWGRSVFHCPFCHGWEVRDRPLAVLDRAPTGVMRSLLLRRWSDEVTLLTNGPAEFDADEAERLRAAGVSVDERPVSGVRGPGTEVEAVGFADGAEHPCRGLLVAVTLHQRSGLGRELGAAIAEPTPVVADGIEVDQILQTSVPGLFAAGDVSAKMPSVANSISAGSIAAASILHDGLDEAPGADQARSAHAHDRGGRAPGEAGATPPPRT